LAHTATSRLLLAVAGAVVVSAMLAGSPADASRATGGGGGGGGHKPDHCVTMGEYDDADVHMTRTAVHRLFDTAGTRTSIARSERRTTEVRTYRVCKSPDSTVTVTYRKHGVGPFRLASKTAVWVG
jgi:hypothetical protein